MRGTGPGLRALLFRDLSDATATLRVLLLRVLPLPVLLFLFLLPLGGCATSGFPATELVATGPAGARELVGGLWSAGSESLLIRQSALFEFKGMRVPISGVMKLEPRAKRARLVGLNDMGVKLYDISVAEESSRTNFVVDELARYPGFAEAVALSVRRIFLAPAPSADDRLEIASKSYLLTRESDSGATIRFTLGGADRQILEKSAQGAAESWRVRYYRYRPSRGRLFPGGIVLEDRQAGYRLTLWTERVEPTDE